MRLPPQLNKNIKKVIGLKHTHIDRSIQVYSKSLEHISNMNIQYLNKKWGPGWRSLKPNSMPFQNTEKQVNYTVYDLNTIRHKYN